jgi:hypothetical protein
MSTPDHTDLAGPARLAAAADGLRLFAHAARTVLVPAFRTVAAALGEAVRAAAPAVVWLAGYSAGYDGRERDWTMPDDWHRGWLRGRLAGSRERRRPAP